MSIEGDEPGQAFACIDQGSGMPPSRLNLNFRQEGQTFIAVSTSPALVFDYTSQRLMRVSEHPDAVAGKITYSKEVKVTGSISGNGIEGTWHGDAATGSFSLRNELGGRASKANYTFTWADFKHFCGEILNRKGNDGLFRGQASHKWDLNTTFHREQRYDLPRYFEFACRSLARELNARLGRRYDINNGLELGAVLSLAQHHGFPTPLLDWTKSPYVAAYFAIAGSTPAGANPRIFVFDIARWNQLPQPANFYDPRPAVSIREFEAYDNPRHLPQQSFHSFTTPPANSCDARALLACRS